MSATLINTELAKPYSSTIPEAVDTESETLK